MIWLKLTHVLKRVWVWLKNHWYLPVIALYTVVIMMLSRRNSLHGYEVLLNARTSHKKEVEVIKATHEKEIEERNKIVKKYSEVIEKLETDYEEQSRTIDSAKRLRAKRLVEAHYNDPEELTKLLRMTFGINYEDG